MENHTTRRNQQSALTRPLCPVHGLALLVGRTVGTVQYRYCRVPGCHESRTTLREKSPHKGLGWGKKRDSPS